MSHSCPHATTTCHYGQRMNYARPVPNFSPSTASARIGGVHARQFPLPYQLRDMTFVAIGVTFAPSFIADHLPANLTPCDDSCGGFFVGLAREGHVLAPFGTGHIWFDLMGHDGSSGPGRYMVRLVSSSPRFGDSIAHRIRPGQSRITEGNLLTVAELDSATGPAFRIAVTQSRNWTASAGIDHAVAPCDAGTPASQLIVTPWAADWCDAEPCDVDIQATDWADFRPTSLRWAAIGKSAAMTLGLSAALAPSVLA